MPDEPEDFTIQHRIAQVIRDLDAHDEVKVARSGETDEYVE